MFLTVFQHLRGWRVAVHWCSLWVPLCSPGRSSLHHLRWPSLRLHGQVLLLSNERWQLQRRGRKRTLLRSHISGRLISDFALTTFFYLSHKITLLLLCSVLFFRSFSFCFITAAMIVCCVACRRLQLLCSQHIVCSFFTIFTICQTEFRLPPILQLWWTSSAIFCFKGRVKWSERKVCHTWLNKSESK